MRNQFDEHLNAPEWQHYLGTITRNATGAFDYGESFAVDTIGTGYDSDEAMSMNGRGAKSNKSENRKNAEHVLYKIEGVGEKYSLNR